MSPDSDPYIPYGRGGAGNMRRRSSIHNAWLHIHSQEQHQHQPKLELTSSPESHYAASKSEPPARSSCSARRRRRSSAWSASTVGGRTSVWKRLFRRGSSEVEEGEGEVVEKGDVE